VIRLAVLLFLIIAAPARAELAIQTVTSPGGIRAWLAESRDIPFVALELRFRGGTSLDAEGQEGAVNLMTALLEEGAGDLDARGFAAAAEDIAASFRFSAGRDSVSVSARFLTETQDDAVALLRLALVDPRFDPEALERVRAQVLSGIRENARRPQSIAGREFAALAFPGHPYGRSETEETVAALTRDDLIAVHRGALARDRVYVAAAGDIDAETLGALIDTLLGSLPETGAPLPGRAEAALAGGMKVVPFDGPQSLIAFGQPGIAFDHPDFLVASMVNEVLGGGRFGTRLTTEVREKRGLTYGIFTALSSGDFGATVTGRVSTDNATAGEVIDLIRAEWERIARDGITGEELAAIQTYQTGAYPLRFDGNARIAEILVGMQMQGLDEGYPQRRNDLVLAITLEEANRVAARLFDPARLTFVIVGQPEGVGNEGQ
jgi:zinc protease